MNYTLIGLILTNLHNSIGDSLKKQMLVQTVEVMRACVYLTLEVHTFVVLEPGVNHSLVEAM